MSSMSVTACLIICIFETKQMAGLSQWLFSSWYDHGPLSICCHRSLKNTISQTSYRKWPKCHLSQCNGKIKDYCYCRLIRIPTDNNRFSTFLKTAFDTLVFVLSLKIAFQTTAPLYLIPVFAKSNFTVCITWNYDLICNRAILTKFEIGNLIII